MVKYAYDTGLLFALQPVNSCRRYNRPVLRGVSIHAVVSDLLVVFGALFATGLSLLPHVLVLPLGSGPILGAPAS